jgi:hypothetical protein
MIYMKKGILLASVGIVIASIFIICILITRNPKNTLPNKPVPPVTPNESRVADTTPNTNPDYISGSDITGYMMKSENSLIHIYEMYDNGNTQLIESLDINPQTLPDADKNDLSKGIILTSYEKMLGLIEDYSS